MAFCYERNLELSGRCQSHNAPPLLRSAHVHGILRSVCKQKARVIAASRKFLYFRVTKEMTIKTSTVGAPLTTALQQSSESYGRNIRAEFLWIRTFYRLHYTLLFSPSAKIFTHDRLFTWSPNHAFHSCVHERPILTPPGSPVRWRRHQTGRKFRSSPDARDVSYTLFCHPALVSGCLGFHPFGAGIQTQRVPSSVSPHV